MSFLAGITPRGYLVMILASFGALLFVSIPHVSVWVC
jgi:hypothetical protein